ncbi:pectate lyase superfamily protein-domain-containing protein [Podospora australis]|uniref:Pectate lyase superfamily protein-domain-containing protein n=1 Tax=Podospora australis TaxID=1536484 RepID=A0AAN7AEW3_9PEZI|nr:pectate lyase superfamily protein-domain-containing protein [Podospora australis]
MLRLSLKSLVTLSALILGAIAVPAPHDGVAADISPAVEKRSSIFPRQVLEERQTGPGCPPKPPGCSDFWLEKIRKQGIAPYAPATNYRVFRNVKDYGARGDGVTDDTAAINRAIAEGDRCAPGGCTGSTKTPALIYFPAGTYLVTKPIINYYYTQLIGNPKCRPVIKAAYNFDINPLSGGGPWVLDTNQYQDGGKLAWAAQNTFWRQIANLVFDLTAVPGPVSIAAIHYPTSQATSLSNVEIRLSQEANNFHEGIFMEEGSGGYVGDLTVIGGRHGLVLGNQQFTFRNINISKAKIGIKQLWSWGWTYVGVTIEDCEIGFDFTANNGTHVDVRSITIIDSKIRNTPVGIDYAWPSPNQPPLGNSFVFENVDLDTVPVAIRGPNGVVLPGTTPANPTRTIPAWVRGNGYVNVTGPELYQGSITPNTRPASLINAAGDYVTYSKPYYESATLNDFLTARQYGARGNNRADDTDALNRLFAAAAARNKIVYLNAGMYRVTRTIRIPPGSRIFGDSSFPVIVSSGRYFDNALDPKPVVQIGRPGERGRIEWSNTIVSTRGKQTGAILIQYNLRAPYGTDVKPAGMWDVHVRVGGFAGSDLQLAQCPKTPGTTVTRENLNRNCIAAFLSWHITAGASGLYQENNWVWVADHDIEEPANNEQITVYAGRGLLLEDTDGPHWLYATSVEHHQLYEYNLHNVSNIFLGQLQTETAYYQPNPDTRLPYPPNPRYHDPRLLAPGQSGIGLWIEDSRDVFVYGAGLYSFFINYDNNCAQVGPQPRCQDRIFQVIDSRVTVYNLVTVGTESMITYERQDTAFYRDNFNGFVSTVALFDALPAP